MKYEKPTILVNSTVAEGVFMASGSVVRNYEIQDVSAPWSSGDGMAQIANLLLYNTTDQDVTEIIAELHYKGDITNCTVYDNATVSYNGNTFIVHATCYNYETVKPGESRKVSMMIFSKNGISLF